MSRDIPANWPSQLDSGLAAMALDLPDDTRERLLAFLGLLQKWNRAYNLTAVREPDEMVSRQLLDSLAILPYVKAPAVLDVGAGGGLPGIPLAIACPDRHITLLDSNSKKTRFLTQCVLELGLDNVEVVHARAEDYRPGRPFTQITSRAFTALANLVSWCGHLLADEGQFLAMKGQFPEDELAALPFDWRLREDIALSIPGCDGARHLLIIDRVRTTGG
ncbi:16S rRNA (guanine(527)-N(7))-methyltransferase RsmG [Marinobacter halodurans]|uniref:Ribosomal RNA small subunit methyltransferase G n=1 Tax=Marinobacter halodurans TaxID=2528979 RepID=A0ABY1ZLG5_9GAMM|nr:16S rRNA (guanine(527)-N(7))-methyltransferase RsmG [Marinobacter halodurans]TBW56444.1 16S rRNA (guanine(527)-N(7))-methyltransferase RsmG [Marinobacter halodurans]